MAPYHTTYSQWKFLCDYNSVHIGLNIKYLSPLLIVSIDIWCMHLYSLASSFSLCHVVERGKERARNLSCPISSRTSGLFFDTCMLGGGSHLITWLVVVRSTCTHNKTTCLYWLKECCLHGNHCTALLPLTLFTWVALYDLHLLL